MSSFSTVGLANPPSLSSNVVSIGSSTRLPVAPLLALNNFANIIHRSRTVLAPLPHDLLLSTCEFLETQDLKDLRCVSKATKEAIGKVLAPLPHDLLLSICEFLETQDLKDLRRASWATKEAIGKDCIFYLDLFRETLTTDDLKKIVKNSPYLLRLNLSNCDITDEHLACLADCSQLRSLDLSERARISDQGLKHLKGLSDLTELYLAKLPNITDAGLEYLKGLSNLNALSLWQCQGISDQGLEHLKGLSNLDYLDLAALYKITEAGLEHLQGLSNLRYLGLGDCRQISNQGMQILENFPNLTILDVESGDCINENRISDEFLEHLKYCPNLTELSINGLRFDGDASLQHLKQLSNLRSLHLSDCDELSNENLEHLKNLPSLTELDLTNCSRITLAGLIHLKGLPHLTELNLFGVHRFTPEEVGDLLLNLPNLNYLTISAIRDSEFTDKEIDYILSRCQSLETLIVNDHQEIDCQGRRNDHKDYLENAVVTDEISQRVLMGESENSYPPAKRRRLDDGFSSLTNGEMRNSFSIRSDLDDTGQDETPEIGRLLSPNLGEDDGEPTVKRRRLDDDFSSLTNGEMRNSSSSSSGSPIAPFERDSQDDWLENLM